MAEERRKIVQLPVLKGSSIDDALTGFATQIEQNEHLGRRVEHAATALSAEIRGWAKVADRIGAEPAVRLRAQVLERVIDTGEAAGGEQVAVGGTPGAPVLTATFSGEEHALRALVAAQNLRDIAARSVHPSIKERFSACVGVNTGTLVHTHVNGSGLEFSAMGTVRMFATRLQEFAGPDQIFLAAATCQAVPVGLEVIPIGPVRTNGDGQQAEAYALRGLATDHAANS